MFRLFEKLLAVLVFGPPLYMLIRYVKWYSRHNQDPEEAQ